MIPDGFRTALLAWIGLILRDVPPSDVFFQSRTEWVPAEGGSFQGRQRHIGQWSPKRIHDSKSSPEWNALILAAGTWPELSEHIDSNAGAELYPTGMLFSDPIYILQPFIPAPAVNDAGAISIPNIAMPVFDKQLERFAIFVESPTVTFRHIVMLPGLRVSEDLLPLKLDERITIERLTPEYVAMFGNMGFITPVTPNGPYEMAGRPWLGATWLQDSRKITHADIDKSTPKLIEASREKNSIHEALASAFALTQFGSVSVGPSATRLDSWDVGGVSFAQSHDPISASAFFLKSMNLDEGDVETLRSVFQRLRSSGLDDAVKIGVRRLAFAMENRRDEDRLLDGMMAAESVMGAQTEIAFKMALRMAFYLHPDDTAKRRATFDDMYSAYDIRSKLVHGKEPNPKKLRIGGKQVPLNEFVRHIEDRIRTALRAMVLSGAVPVWNDLIVGNSAPEPSDD